MALALHHQPLKAIFVLYTIGTVLLRLPAWIALSLIPAFRGNKGFTFKQALLNRISRQLLTLQAQIRIRTPSLALATLPRGLPPARLESFTPQTGDSSPYTGILASDPAITAQPTSGVWYPSKPASPADATQGASRVCLHFHGGAFVIGSPAPVFADFGASLLRKHAAGPQGAVLFAGYRLSSNRGGRFPAALQDAVTVYTSLIAQGYSAEHIVIGGDSAGANLATALLRWLREEGTPRHGIPPPGYALLWSPWVDVGAALEQAEASIARNPRAGSDYINAPFGRWGAASYVGAIRAGEGAGGADTEARVGEAERELANGPWCSPLRHAFAVAPETRVWVQTCDAEILYHDDVKFFEGLRDAAKAAGGADGRVVLHVDESASHDIFIAGDKTGFDKTAWAAAEAAGKFVHDED